MGTENPSVLTHAQSAVTGDQPPSRATPRPRVHPAGVTHENTRHTSRFTVIGNHLAQHPDLSLLAIGLACHIQSLPTGARIDIKTLTGRFPEGATRISAALRELENNGYLRRERRRTSAGRIVTRTVSCNQPGAHETARRHGPTPGHTPPRTDGKAPDTRGPREPKPHEPRKKHPLPPVPQPAYPSPVLLRTATDLLAALHRQDARLLLNACDTAHLAPGVAAWLERDVTPAAVGQALSTDLPPGGPRRPAALLTHRLTAQLPPLPPFRTPADPPTIHHPLRNCDGCDRAFRAPEPETRCGNCRTAVPRRPSGGQPHRTTERT
ncbi:helix-turn-helix domain-containing protein [Streptomyces sp. NPDC006012]|uniref:helix-turn-helix domain-containing protein n=1 Tax=Streptomyces sp. NPDC006012 TaxID=3364739 RepID=UPI003696FC10